MARQTAAGRVGAILIGVGALGLQSGCNVIPNIFAALLGITAGSTGGSSAPAITDASVAVDSDIRYPSPGSTDNRIDIYRPTTGITPGAVTILYVHGGSWRAGDKVDEAPLFELLARAGYPVVSGNYTLSTDTLPGFPQAVIDAKAIVRWIRTDGAATFGLPGKIIAMGDSAGGHLAEMIGTTAGVSQFEPLPPPPGGYRVDGVIAFFAPADLAVLALLGLDGFATTQFIGSLLDAGTVDLYASASPITYVTPDDPPMALFQGGVDPVVPFIEAFGMVQAFAQTCRYCRLSLFPDAAHGYEGFGGKEGAAQLTLNLVPLLLADPSAADLTGDGSADALDVQRLVQLLIDPDAAAGAQPRCDPLLADLNHDGQVDADDVQAFLNALINP